MDIIPAAYHCPRWNELPAVALYMDQVLLILQDAVSPLIRSGEAAATATMINNYVKIKLIAPSQKKKYSRDHMARLIMITLLKRVLTMTELDAVLHFENTEELYNNFCASLEANLRDEFSDNTEKNVDLSCPPLMTAAIRTLSCKLRFEAIMGELRPVDE